MKDMAIFLCSLKHNHFLFVEIFKVALCIPACWEKLAVWTSFKIFKADKEIVFSYDTRRRYDGNV